MVTEYGEKKRKWDRQTERSRLRIYKFGVILSWFEDPTSFIWKKKRIKDYVLYITLYIKKFVLYLHTIYLTHLKRVNLRAETSSTDNTVLPRAWINKLYNSHKIKQISCVKKSAGWIYSIFIFLAHILEISCNNCYMYKFFLDFNPVTV